MRTGWVINGGKRTIRLRVINFPSGGRRLGVDFVMGVGGSFDVLAGEVKRAPQWMQRAGLEWLYRVLQEPRRMAGRYLGTNSRFALLLAKEWMAKKRG